MAVSGAQGGGDLRVDVDQLANAAGTFESVAAALAAHRLTTLEQRFATGSDLLDLALDGFAQTWSGGLSLIQTAQTGIAQGLRTTVAEYAGVDRDVHDSLRARHRRFGERA